MILLFHVCISEPRQSSVGHTPAFYGQIAILKSNFNTLENNTLCLYLIIQIQTPTCDVCAQFLHRLHLFP